MDSYAIVVVALAVAVAMAAGGSAYDLLVRSRDSDWYSSRHSAVASAIKSAVRYGRAL